jgi:hypothetical protein
VLELIWFDCDLLCDVGLECVDEKEWRGEEKERLLMLSREERGKRKIYQQSKRNGSRKLRSEVLIGEGMREN